MSESNVFNSVSHPYLDVIIVFHQFQLLQTDFGGVSNSVLLNTWYLTLVVRYTLSLRLVKGTGIKTEKVTVISQH